ncbi:MAG: M16 family metallopeptidase [Phycisphaerales bacterium]
MARLETRMLDCGMPLIVESIPGVRSIGVAWYVPAGYGSEPESKQGLGAMWNELLMRGCGDLDSRGHADALDSLGITRSVDGGAVFMRFGYTLVGARLTESLPLLVDMVRRPRMDEESIEPVRDLALQAIESLKDDPPQRASLRLRELHSPTPINRSGLGTPETLGRITREDLVGEWGARAVPGGSIMSIAGEVESAGGADGIARSLDVLLKGWTGQAAEVKPGSPTGRGAYDHIEDKAAQVHIVLAHEAPREVSEDSPLERVVSSVLSGGMSARLFIEVREKRGLCYSVSQSYSAERDWGQCTAYVGTQPDRAQESLNVLIAELRKMDQGWAGVGEITQEEFDIAITGIKSRIIFSGESTSARAHALAGDYYKRGKARSLDEITRVYDALTLERVREYVKRRKMGEVTIVTLGQAGLERPR